MPITTNGGQTCPWHTNVPVQDPCIVGIRDDASLMGSEANSCREVGMSSYETVVVGTDGSESSMKAVERAGALAGDAQLVIACAYFPNERGAGDAADVLKDEAYQVTGSTPTEEILRTAKERATKAGASNVVQRPVKGAPVDALLQLVSDVKADLLVVGNRGLNSIAGRLLGSVPADVARKSACDVLIVHTT